ncbi:LOW QUALITY PROTEIN: ent-copalyl diphosphate synthase 1-like [Populus alba]|uniref:LOW QUALITY PROTEIN: ent-copalyl diphosphate synthase 1-like n=1 Tax=Populus alba TaxID=43335 RepID=UPI00158D9927|nr:LOW QUALITY PROTEIN: (-)-kolavenyl diphosphate synthase TPS28, chloroplastic-like [Populus alba]
MSSHQYYSSIHLFSTVIPSTPRSSFSSSNNTIHPLPPPSGVWLYGARGKQDNFHASRCSAISKPRTQGYADLFHQQNGLPLINWPHHDVVEDDTEEDAAKVSVAKEIDEHVKTIKAMLEMMEDGEISISAYDTAWVALVEDINGSGLPQFPSSLQWIANNQLPDGSWGDAEIFLAHDRLINTLACVVALKSWNLHQEKCEKGMLFFRDNLCKLEDENAEHMPIGFEVAFPSLLEIAKKLDIEVPYDSPVLQEIYASRNLKLTRIPKDIMHNVPTTLLHSLEGMPGLEWKKLLKLQSQDGSFLFSPSSTAFALSQTKDKNCMEYLNKAVQRFEGGVPNVYPVDLFEHIWAVDRLQRLGISRYFESQIDECVSYIHRYWTEDGICWARNSEVHDIDDTAMGFRVLRLNGHHVSADVFKHFEKGGEFFCFAGQSTAAVTGMLNLYRASQLLFPGEKILEKAKEFSFKFLREKQAANELLDKWLITKDLPGEVGFALEIPWHASLPRVESRFYIEQYGGEDDVWIGKTLYRMPYVNNNEYLQLARLDYNNCQALHRIEWANFQKWYEECNLRDFGISRKTLLYSYFVAAASVFEPERSNERLAWAKTAILLEMIHSYFHEDSDSSGARRRTFVHEFSTGISINGRRTGTKKTRKELVKMLLGTLNQLSFGALEVHGRDISHSLRHAWERWLLSWELEGDRRRGEAELLVQTINLTAGYLVSEELLAHHPQYEQLADLANRICYQLGYYQKNKVHGNGSYSTITGSTDRITTPQIESDMQELMQLVIQKTSDGIDTKIKQTFLQVAKSFYYTAFCDPGTINYHIAKVLFETVA